MICEKTTPCFFDLLKDCSKVQCANKSLCVSLCDNRLKAICTEKGKTYCLLNEEKNPSTILALHIDGGVISNDKHTPPGTEKCDYLFLVDGNNAPIAILVELKGTAIKKAAEQIYSTLQLFSKTFGKCERVYGRIIHSGGTPNLQNTPAISRLKRELRSHNGDLLALRKVEDKIHDLRYK